MMANSVRLHLKVLEQHEGLGITILRQQRVPRQQTSLAPLVGK